MKHPHTATTTTAKKRIHLNLKRPVYNKTKKSIPTKENPIQIQGKRYKKKNGWIKVMIYGAALERGYAHGYLLQKELIYIRETILPFLINESLEVSYEKYETDCKTHITPQIQKHFPEFYQEMQGIVSGANHHSITLDFIIAWNSYLSMASFYKRRSAVDRCTAFIAVGNATEKGDIVMGHTTHSDLVLAYYFNIVLEIIPSDGQKMIMQTCPGFICSGSDWFLCENGIIGCETTISEINYKPKFGVPYYCRIRQAMQYGKSLDDYVEIMKKNNSGDYACSWLLGDTKKNEIMLLEIALTTMNVEKKTDGIFYGMNSAISPEIREKDTTDKTYWKKNESSGARNIRLHVLLYEKYYGKLNTDIAREILADHYDVDQEVETDGNHLSLCKHDYADDRPLKRGIRYPFGCTDGKVIDSQLAKQMQFVGRMGPACGYAFSASKYLKQNPKYKKWKTVLRDYPNEPWVKLK